MSIKLTTSEFINRAKQVHGDTYDYSKVKYKNNKTKVTIICKKHGDFEQIPSNHLSGVRCKKCHYDKLNNMYSFTKEEFINKSNKIHNNKYDYSLVEYVNAKTKVKIVCPVHGVFEQVPESHLKGSGCIDCVYKGGWKTKDWINISKTSKNFDSFKVYIIRCWNGEEEFYKIGRTYLDIKQRFLTKREMPYNYEVVKIFEGTAQEMFTLENNLQKNNKKFSYIPFKIFNGYKECFSKLNVL